MRLLTFVLTSLLVFIQYPLWFGKGGLMRVQSMQMQLTQLQQKITDQQTRNLNLETEVEDLKAGGAAIEARARYQMGMMKQGEIFVQALKVGSEVK